MASYVKWIESAGARVVPLFYNATDAELAVAFHSVSGLVLAGGYVRVPVALSGSASRISAASARICHTGHRSFCCWVLLRGSNCTVLYVVTSYSLLI